MRPSVLPWICRLVAVLALLDATGNAQVKKRVVVFPFDDRASENRDVQIGTKVAELLAAKLAAGGGYTVVNRAYVEGVLAEKNLKYDSTSDSVAVAREGLLGMVDVVIIGKVVAFRVSTSQKKKGNIFAKKVETDGDVVLQTTARVIRVRDGSILAAPSADDVRTVLLGKSDDGFGEAIVKRQQGTTADSASAADRALRSLVDEAADAVAKQLWTGFEAATEPVSEMSIAASPEAPQETVNPGEVAAMPPPAVPTSDSPPSGHTMRPAKGPPGGDGDEAPAQSVAAAEPEAEQSLSDEKVSGASHAPAPPQAAPAKPAAPETSRAPSSVGSVSAMPAPAPVPSPQLYSNDEYASGDRLTKWLDSLRLGRMDVLVPSPMTDGKPSRVFVCMRGYQNTTATPAAPCLPIPGTSQGFARPFGQTDASSMGPAGASIQQKVSSDMRVELLAADPAEFAIAPTDHAGTEFVPNDGFTYWSWDVTPTAPKPRQELKIIVYLIHKEAASGADAEAFDGGTYLVDVNVDSLWRTFRDRFWSDPVAAFKLVLPGGSIYLLFAPIVVFFAHRFWKGKTGKSQASPVPEMTDADSNLRPMAKSGVRGKDPKAKKKA